MAKIENSLLAILRTTHKGHSSWLNDGGAVSGQGRLSRRSVPLTAEKRNPIICQDEYPDLTRSYVRGQFCLVVLYPTAQGFRQGNLLRGGTAVLDKTRLRMPGSPASPLCAM